MGIFGTPQDQVDLDDLKSRVAKLEAAVATLQAQLAAGAASTVTTAPNAEPAQAAWLGEVRALKEGGNLIEAIKRYREHTGVGLKEAKDAVEALY